MFARPTIGLCHQSSTLLLSIYFSHFETVLGRTATKTNSRQCGIGWARVTGFGQIGNSQIFGTDGARRWGGAGSPRMVERTTKCRKIKIWTTTINGKLRICLCVCVFVQGFICMRKGATTSTNRVYLSTPLFSCGLLMLPPINQHEWMDRGSLRLFKVIIGCHCEIYLWLCQLLDLIMELNMNWVFHKHSFFR